MPTVNLIMVILKEYLMSAFIDGIVAKAKELDKVIVLPETDDERVLKAAAIAVKEKIARVMLIGNREKIDSKAKELGIDLSAALCEDPVTSEYLDEFVTKFQKKREKKGMTLEKAKEIMSTD